MASCSSTQKAYIKNVNIFLDVKDGIQLTDEDIKTSKADLVYILSGERPGATMALAFIENGEYKWVSRDNVVFVMQNGRMKRTAGLNRDLLYISNLENDPLKNGGALTDGSTWVRHLDAENDCFGVRLTSDFEITRGSIISIQDENFRTVKVTELVSFQSNAQDDDHWINTFWYDENSGQLLKSIQKNSPEADVYDITYVSRAVRLSTPTLSPNLEND